MHPVETAFRRFKSDHPIFAEALAQFPEVVRSLEGTAASLPEVTAAASNFHLVLAKMFPRLPQRGMDYVNQLAEAGNLWSAYRETRHIYRPTGELARELAKLKQPLQFPVRGLHLPRRGIVLDLTAHLGQDHPSAYILLAYDTGESADASVAPLLRMAQVSPDGTLRTLMLLPSDLGGDSLWEGRQKFLRGSRNHLALTLKELRDEHGEHPERMIKLMPLILQWADEVRHYDRDLAQTPEEFLEENPVVALVINTLFYLQGDPDVVKAVHPGRAPLKPRVTKQAPNLQKLNRRLDNMEPTVQPIGDRFTAAIQHYEIERSRLEAEHVGGSKRPHLRIPHLHTYRTGQDRLDVCLKFLGWIGVGGAEVPQALRDAFVTITPVK